MYHLRNSLGSQPEAPCLVQLIAAVVGATSLIWNTAPHGGFKHRSALCSHTLSWHFQTKAWERAGSSLWLEAVSSHTDLYASGRWGKRCVIQRLIWQTSAGSLFYWGENTLLAALLKIYQSVLWANLQYLSSPLHLASVSSNTIFHAVFQTRGVLTCFSRRKQPECFACVKNNIFLTNLLLGNEWIISDWFFP